MAAANLAVLVQPPGRGERIAQALESRGYRVALHHDVESAHRYLRRVRAVALLFVDQGERWFAGNDLLSCVEEFPSLRHARVFVTLKNRNSVFAAALGARGAALLFHPVSRQDVDAIVGGDRPVERVARALDAWHTFLRLRDQSERLCMRTRRTIAESRRLCDVLLQSRHSLAGGR